MIAQLALALTQWSVNNVLRVVFTLGTLMEGPPESGFPWSWRPHLQGSGVGIVLETAEAFTDGHTDTKDGHLDPD